MRIGWGILLVAACMGGPAFAQEGAYRAGLRVATARGYDNADCYARVFAKHAVVVEKPNGRLSWYAPSTPAYNAEQRSRCGVDRLQDLAARRGSGSLSTQPSQAGGYRAGLRVAAQRGYHGSDASCFARTFATFASLQPVGGRVTYAIAGASMHPYSQALFQACRISR